ncbi:MAG TPA: DCC1-like thiol-disulfide oxidoreductase family protein [Solirubrobacteraceae bacterium]|jgi:predicted DCC family thiol-disulfide oxidoreductase YuxK|nr:DCC1-like thiol-disulfide oxidoreductase family protein [Solirubrobacteraceae bacterium]
MSDDGLVVLYDGQCGFCRVILATLLKWDRTGRLTPVAIQSTRGEQLLAELEPQDRLASWHLVDARGALRSGGAAIPVVFDALPCGKPIASIAERFPATTARAYVWIAGHRVLLGRPLGARARAWAGGVIGERESSETS